MSAESVIKEIEAVVEKPVESGTDIAYNWTTGNIEPHQPGDDNLFRLGKATRRLEEGETIVMEIHKA